MRPCDEAARAEAKRRGLDMRKVYALIEGELCVAISITSCCSGCTDGQHVIGWGCRECGHTGKRRRSHFVPADRHGSPARFRGAARYDQFRRLKEVDPDLTFRRYLAEYAGRDGNP